MSREKYTDKRSERFQNKWIQSAEEDVKKRGTEGVCTGSKFGSDSCPPGSKRYNMAKTLRKMGHERHEEAEKKEG